MEVISSSSNHTMFVIGTWVFGILFLVSVALLILDSIQRKELTSQLVFAVFACLCIFIVFAIKLEDKSLVYVVHVDNETTVYELTREYDVLSYEKVTDTWRVKLKESEER